jgi:hypothetical protein
MTIEIDRLVMSILGSLEVVHLSFCEFFVEHTILCYWQNIVKFYNKIST